MDPVRLLVGDCREMLRTLPAESVQTCVTSPPYFGLRDYGVDGQLGLEDTPAAYVAGLVAVFREVRRVLKDDGTVWLNLGDSYASDVKGSGGTGEKSPKHHVPSVLAQHMTPRRINHGLKVKDLIGIPWRVAFALQDDGWYLRSDIIWHKPNVMPESVKDRPTKAHEYLFLLAKSDRYYYDADAIKEPAGPFKPCGPASRADNDRDPKHGTSKQDAVGNRRYAGFNERWKNRDDYPTTRNRRTVWSIGTKPYSGAHFAVFPEALAEPCILAGCPEGGTVLDPFAGSGTTLAVALRNGRHAIGIELNPAYCELAQQRIAAVQPRLLHVS